MSHRILQHFNFTHSKMEEIIEPYKELAQAMNALLDEGPEKELALQKLLESCDSALRAREIDKTNKRHDMLVSALATSVNRTKPGMVPQQTVRS